MGYRLRGNFALNDINYTDISENVGHPQSLPHTVKYKYIRHDDVGSSNNIERQFNNTSITLLTHLYQMVDK